MTNYCGEKGFMLVTVKALIKKPLQIFKDEQSLRDYLKETVWELVECKPKFGEGWSYEIRVGDNVDAVVYKVEVR